MREFSTQLRPQVCADIDHGREGILQLHFVGNTGVDQNAVIEISRQNKADHVLTPKPS